MIDAVMFTMIMLHEVFNEEWLDGTIDSIYIRR